MSLLSEAFIRRFVNSFENCTTHIPSLRSHLVDVRMSHILLP